MNDKIRFALLAHVLDKARGSRLTASPASSAKEAKGAVGTAGRRPNFPPVPFDARARASGPRLGHSASDPHTNRGAAFDGNAHTESETGVRC